MGPFQIPAQSKLENVGAPLVGAQSLSQYLLINNCTSILQSIFLFFEIYIGADMSEILQKMPLTSMNMTEERIAELKKLFPEVFRENQIDFEALQRSLGKWIDPGKERFGLNWPGKAECMRLIQQASIGTLLPMYNESINFDT